MLAICLERLQQFSRCPPVHISIDYVPLDLLNETRYIRDSRMPNAVLHHQPEHPVNQSSGCWNILHAMKIGYETGAEYVFMLEDDVQVYPNWLQWHLSQICTGDYVATCGRRIPLFFEKHGDIYTNPGSCLRRDLLEKLVPHINNDYFGATAPYIRKTFGREPINSSLDDGLVRMVCQQMGGICKYPDKPTCAHQGLDWYQNLDIFMNPGSVEERIFGLRKILEILRVDPRYIRYSQDFEPYDP